MPKIVTLKDNNDDIVYPITPIDAVFTDTSVTLENMIDAKADTDLTNVVNGSVTTNKLANSAVTSDKIDWTTLDSSVELTSLGSPAHLSNIQNHSRVIGGKYFIVDFVAKLTTSNTSYSQVGKFTLPKNVGYESPVSMALEGGAIRYGYIESNGTVALATNSAASNLVLRVNGIIYLEG